ncbi:MAG: YbaN family protein [Neisseria sp.]|nr:YbaN family protein [Neisseria sp.]
MPQISRPFFLILGTLAFLTGVAGIFLPVLPTTPFILLAAYCAAKSSPRFHAYLQHHRIFGPMLHQWQNDRAISRRTKTFAGVMILFSLAALHFVWAPPVVARYAASLLMLAAMLWLFYGIKTAPTRPDTDPTS